MLPPVFCPEKSPEAFHPSPDQVEGRLKLRITIKKKVIR